MPQKTYYVTAEICVDNPEDAHNAADFAAAWVREALETYALHHPDRRHQGRLMIVRWDEELLVEPKMPV